jgi:hypothetical protein
LEELVAPLPIGTNLGIYNFLWMLLRGELLASRGAIFPALSALGLEDAEVRRSWAAMRYGSWDIEELLESWRKYVKSENKWEPVEYAGYKVKALDLTAYWRLRLKIALSKHYDSTAGKALKAVVFGLSGKVGKVGEERVTLLTDVIRADLDNPSEAALEKELLKQVAIGLDEDEIVAIDAGFKPKALLDARLKRFVLRLSKNFTARRNQLPEYKGGRRAEYGEIIRPLARSYNGKQTEATPPDSTDFFEEDGVEIKVEYWDGVVLREDKVSSDNQLFWIVAIHSPHYEEPWLFAIPFPIDAKDAFHIYINRWPIEQPPLASKQMIGAHRQFVSSEESSYRFPELTLLAGSILTYLAAKLPPIPTGFWDIEPKRTSGRLRRYLKNIPFSNLPHPSSGRIRKKASVTVHLPKGILGHRRSKTLLPA